MTEEERFADAGEIAARIEAVIEGMDMTATLWAFQSLTARLIIAATPGSTGKRLAYLGAFLCHLAENVGSDLPHIKGEWN